MVKHCTVAGCFNTHKDDANLFQFTQGPQCEAKLDQCLTIPAKIPHLFLHYRCIELASYSLCVMSLNAPPTPVGAESAIIKITIAAKQSKLSIFDVEFCHLYLSGNIFM